jgi:hypothetical protein
MLVSLFLMSECFGDTPRVMHPRKLITPCSVGTWATRGQIVHICREDEKWHTIMGGFDYILRLDNPDGKIKWTYAILTDGKTFVTCNAKDLPTPKEAIGRVDISSMRYIYEPQHKDKFLLCD